MLLPACTARRGQNSIPPRPGTRSTSPSHREASSPAAPVDSTRLPFAAPGVAQPSLPNDDLRPTSHLRKAGKSWNQAPPALAKQPLPLHPPPLLALQASKSGDGDRASRALHYYVQRHVDGDGAATPRATILATRARSCVLHAFRPSKPLEILVCVS